MKLKSGLNLFSKILIIQAMALALASCTISHSKENQAAITATGGTETSRTIFLALNLSDLSVSSAALSPEFSPRHVTYSATTSNETITVTASVPDPTFIITVDDQEIASGSSSQPIALSKGINYVIITVASADRTLQTSYLLSINKTVDNGSTSGVSSYKDVPFQSYIGCDKNTPNVLNIGVVGLQYYIPIQAPDGNIRYAHDGATFTLNQNGQVVLARNMDYLLSPQIYLPADAEKVTITSTGTILVKMPGQVSHQVVGQIQLATFMNPDGLAAIEFGLYAETADSGTPMTSQAYSNFFTGDIITYCEGVIYSDYTTPPLVVDQAKLHIRINNAPIATYFPLMQADGSVAYTNDTEFMVDQAGYIRHYSSKLLLQPQLTIPLWSMLDLSSLSINDTGTVTVADQNGNTQQLGQLQIVQFMNPNGLQQSLQDPSVYRDTADSGQPIYMNAGGTQGVMDFYSMEIKKLRDYPARPVLDPTYNYQEQAESHYLGCDIYGKIQLQVSDYSHYFILRTETGEHVYFRGNMQLSRDVQGRLVDQYAQVLEPEITIPQGYMALKIYDNGVITAKTAMDAQETQLGQIQLAAFVGSPNPVADKTGYYMESAESGTPIWMSPNGGFFAKSLLYCGSTIPWNQNSNGATVTNTKIHLILQNNNFIALINNDGTRSYTDDAVLSIDQTGRLIHYASKLPIDPGVTIPSDYTQLNIDTLGVVTVLQGSNIQPTTLGQIQLYRFVNPSGMDVSAINNAIYRETEFSGSPIQGAAGSNGFGIIELYSIGHRTN